MLAALNSLSIVFNNFLVDIGLSFPRFMISCLIFKLDVIKLIEATMPFYNIVNKGHIT